MAARLEDFAPLRPAEARLAAWLQKGNRELCEISPGLPPEDAAEEVRLRASFVRYLALGGCDACRTTEKGLRVQGAFIEGDGPEGAETRGLNLEECRLPGDLALVACRFPDLVLMRGAVVRSVFLNDSRLGGGLIAVRVKAKGEFFLRGITATGAVQLPGAKVGGNVDVAGAKLTAGSDDIAFLGDGLEAKGDLFFRGINATGEVRLLSAKLSNLEADRARFDATATGSAFVADRLEATGNVFLRGVKSVGTVRFVGARLGGQLDARSTVLTAAGDGFAFVADELEAKGGVFFHSVAATGTVRLLRAKLSIGLGADNASFSGADADHAFFAEGLEVDGPVIMRGTLVEGRITFAFARIKTAFQTNADTRMSGTLDLRAAQIGTIIDNPIGWPTSLKLDRCCYGAFVMESPVDAASRIRWLSLQDDDFMHPQPWEECARVLREMGHGTAARDILIEKEKRQRAARRAAVFRSSLNLGPLYAWAYGLWDGGLGATVRYGRQPLLAFAWLFGFWLFGAVIFASAEGQGALKPNLPQIQRAPEWVLCRVPEGEAADLPSVPGGATGLREESETQYACYLRQPETRAYPAFNALIYSADTLLPVVSLEMQAYWLPDEDVAPGGWVRAYRWVHIAAGWALSLLAVAGFSGLIRTDNTK